MNTATPTHKPSYEELRSFNDELHKNNLELDLEVNYLRQELAKIKRLIFGQKRERFISNIDSSQLPLGLGILKVETEVKSEQISYERKKVKKKKGHGRKELPGHLPRKEIVIEPQEDTSGMEKIGEEVTEELDYIPGKIYVTRYIRPKYLNKSAEKIICATLPTRPIEKGIAGPGLIAHIIISKYVDHLPLYRQRQQFKRKGIRIPESTIGGWVSGGSELLKPLYLLFRKEIESSSYLNIDETTIKVQDRRKKGKCHQGYYWTYYSPGKKILWYDYRDSRSREGPNRVLKDYQGIIQTDGYSGYNEISRRTGIVSVACMAHIRRNFFEALDQDKERSEYILKQIRRLYRIERCCRKLQLSAERRQELREKHSRPIMKRMKAWLLENSTDVIPKSAIGKAINYALGQWPRMENYLQDGRIEIDNNLVENAIRPIALGRKNYLFAGSHNGASNAAVIYSLVATAKLNGLNPFTYLRDVLNRILDYPHKKLADLLPQNWEAPSPDESESTP